MTVADSDSPDSSASSGQSTSLTLLVRLRANENEAWQTMVQLYSPLVHYWCRRGGVQGADAEDVSQNVFRAAAVSLPDFRRDRPGDSFRGWLRGITRHKILQHFRQNKRHPPPSGGTDAQRRLEAQADPSAEASEEDDPTEELDALHRRALEIVRSEFEERTWRAFWLTVVEGRSPVDIAAESGVSPAAIRMAKSRVLHRLKEEFGDLL
jgi:RNA polymerase sigma-70 factor, ECF subfamily